MLSRLLSLLLLALAVARSLPTSAAEIPETTTTVQGGAKIIRDLPYVSHPHARQLLDLYLPAESTGVRPLLVYIHGGGWREGNKSGVDSKILLARGYAVASLDYRLSQDGPYPAQIEDCKAAIRWLRAHAAEYELDPARIGAWGTSAGAHLAALLGTTGQIKDFDKGENLDQSSAVQCVVDWFGPTDFLHWGSDAPAQAKGESAVTHLLGDVTGDELREAARRASPVTFISPTSAPTLILHGDKDPLVPLQQSVVFDEALRKAGVESKLITIPGAKHGGPEFFSPLYLLEMGAFLEKHLKPTGPK